MPTFSIHFEDILSRVHGNLEEQNKVLEPPLVIITYCIFFLLALQPIVGLYFAAL